MALIMGESSRVDFQEVDVQLLRSGTLADATIKCQGRTWKVHRMLLSSRIKFFKAAFCGKFAEATSREVDLPEADPDSVDIMLRHLYGDDLNVEDLKTPVLCVRTWKLGNYMQLETLKKVSISSLSDHLNAMALLATDGFLDKREPKWLSHFFDAFQEVCADIVTTPLRNNFISFIWICKFEMGLLPRTLDVLKQYPEVNQELLQLLIKNKPQDGLYWFPNIRNIEWHAKNRKETIRPIEVICSNCRTKIEATKRPIFFNPFPVGQVTTGELKWCRACAENLNGHRKWPWGSCGGGQWEKVKVEAWSWFEDKES